jgi:uncharacterized protein (DUF433 family)
LTHLEAGESIANFLEGFPSVKREQVLALLEESKLAFRQAQKRAAERSIFD